MSEDNSSLIHSGSSVLPSLAAMSWSVDPSAAEEELRLRMGDAAEAMKPVVMRLEILRNMLKIVNYEESLISDILHTYFSEQIRFTVESSLLDHDYELHKRSVKENGSSN